ncbi:MAG: hypothetical protein ACYDBJ_06920 [Aggregatilineales bacterium]
MNSNASSSFSKQDTLSLSAVYSTSETERDPYEWIQPSISRQTLDTSRSSVIDGLYVQILPPEVSSIEGQIAAMAADPDIQREIRQIQAEFASTDMDGLIDDP